MALMVADSETEELQAHPLAECFPRMSDDEILSLAEDIERHGLSVPIVLYEGMILDGRNRYRACREFLKMVPRFADYSGNDPVGFVWSLNGERRSLTHEQRVAAYFSLYRSEIEKTASEIEQERRRKQGETRSGGTSHANDLSSCNATRQVSASNPTRRTLAERLNCSPDMIRRFTALTSAPDVVKEVAYGAITLAAAEKKVGLGRKPRERSAASEKAGGMRGPSTQQRPRKPRVPANWDPNLVPGQVLHIPQPRNSPSDRLLDRVYRLVGGFPTREVGLPLAEEVATSAETFSKEAVTKLVKHLKATEKVRRALMEALDGHLKRDTSGSGNGSTE